MQIKEVKKAYSSLVERDKHELTIFMTAHNREEYIEEAIEGVLNNTYKNYCIIVLDNCSTDRTREKVEKYERIYENVFYIYRESIMSYGNFQFAVDFCKTSFFMVLHDDDVVLSNCFGTILDKMKENNYVAISSASWLVNENNVRMENQSEQMESALFFKNDEYLENYLRKNRITMCFPVTMYQTDFMQKHPEFFNINAGPCVDDYIFFQLCRLGGTIGILPEKLINYRLHANQDSQVRRKYMFIQLYNFLLNDSYYRNILKKHKKGMRFDLWNSFKCLFLEYNLSKIPREEYLSFFSNPCVKFALYSWEGLDLLCLMKGIVKFNNIAYLIYQRKKRG